MIISRPRQRAHTRPVTNPLVKQAPEWTQAARRNVIRNRVADRVDVRHSDVFSAVDGEFDLVVFNPPSRWFTARDLLEVASADENYRTLTTFVRNVGRYLRVNGRVLIFFGTTGDLGYLRQLLVEEGFRIEVLNQRKIIKDGTQVYYYTHRVTRLA